MKTQLLLRLALAFVFLYAGVAILLNPQNWIGFIPDWAVPFGDKTSALKIHGLADIVLGLWILSGWRLKISSAMAFLMLLGILIASGLDEITFRDVGLALAALGLHFYQKEKEIK
ncbi:DoxX family membrane protein [Candidatus Parcubacteria bacterium]|nr:MAG: DoxX family membrane protein [Candidatus Parcubacteria bacterium]